MSVFNIVYYKYYLPQKVLIIICHVWDKYGYTLQSAKTQIHVYIIIFYYKKKYIADEIYYMLNV